MNKNFINYQRYILFFLVNIFILFVLSNNLCADGDNIYKIKKVVIDPGHGGKDPGAVGKKAYEKDIVLSISLKLGDLIQKNFGWDLHRFLIS